MSGVRLTIGEQAYFVLAEAAADISIAIDFRGGQPNHFRAPPASARPLESGGFVGDTRAGGSCNCDVLTITPHCNGTHTECVGHVTGDRIAVAGLAREPLVSTALISVAPVQIAESGESADPAPETTDRLVTATELGIALQKLHGSPVDALVVRTLPNDDSKRTRDYSEGLVPPYFSHEAMKLIVSWDIRHLLTDLPSVDRSHDGGRLSGHRLFWGLDPGETGASQARRPEATITEMIYAPETVPDGLYALSLQVAPFLTDAAPSRPILYPLEPA